MENFLLLAVLGSLTIYFYGNMQVCKSLHIQILEEKKLAEEKVQHLEAQNKQLDKQLESALMTAEEAQRSLKNSREDYQALKLEKTELEHKNRLLQERINELYASVGTVN
jgi:peptidoglycan hydrolase CwlO-like protein